MTLFTNGAIITPIVPTDRLTPTTDIVNDTPIERTNAERIAEIKQRFPLGCTVRRKPDAPVTETSRRPEAKVINVIITGVHSDVFLQAQGMMSVYLDPDAYDIVGPAETAIFKPAPGVTYPIDENTPRDGRKVLVFGTAEWETLQNHSPKSAGWYVAVWTDELTTDYDHEDMPYVGGFKTVTNNPYKDYVLATHWQVYPDNPKTDIEK